MRYILTTLFVIIYLNSYSQVADTLRSPSNKAPGRVSFITTLDVANATKDGIYLNGYVVNIGYEEAKRLNGKKIKVTGKVTIVKGVDNHLKESEKNTQEIKQGRSEDTKHLLSPKIRIIG